MASATTFLEKACAVCCDTHHSQRKRCGREGHTSSKSEKGLVIHFHFTNCRFLVKWPDFSTHGLESAAWENRDEET
jgi:hypothetical protein